ncbi:MFS transporter [Methylomusa anaerophila]|nr:MFS transporter [Methylomusa anaerophila]
MNPYKLQTVALVLLSFTLGCSEFVVVGILSDIAGSLQVPVSQVGILVTAFALVYAVATPIITLLLGPCSHYRSLLLLTVVFIVGNLLSFLSESYLLLCVSRVLTGAVSGPIIAFALTFANRIAPREKKAFIISWVFSGFSIAAVFGVPIGAWISAAAGWRASFLVITVASAIVLFLLAAVLPRRSAAISCGIAEQLGLFKDRRIQLGVLLPLFGSGGIYVVYTYLQPILSTILAYPIHWVTTLLFLYGTTTILSNQLSGVLARKSGLHKMPAVYLLQTALMFTLPLFLNFRAAGTAVILILGITMYLLNSPIQMHFLAVAEQDYPQSVVLASSLNSIFFNFGISLGSLVGGLIVDHAGLGFVGFGGGGLSFTALLLVLTLNRFMTGRRRAALAK